MQRYERELNEILRDLGCVTLSEDPRAGQSGSPAHEPEPDDSSQAEHTGPMRLAARSIALFFIERTIGLACLLLAMAIIVLPLASALSAPLMVLSLAILLVSLKLRRPPAHGEGDPTVKDWGWTDVTVQARRHAPDVPQKRDDSFWPQ